MKTYVIELNEYQVANLEAAILAIGFPAAAPASPLNVLNTGNWLEEVYRKLGDLPDRDREWLAAPSELAQRALSWTDSTGRQARYGVRDDDGED